jgi:putative PIN family toxin of toxin-antitoxin system
MTTVVVDSNVYISALVFGGIPERVLDRLDTGGFLVCVSQSIVDEVTEVLRNKFEWRQTELDYALPPLWSRARTVKPIGKIAACADPEDNRILECAQACRARFLITGDDHLLRMKRFEDVEIIFPRTFLSLLQGPRNA